jgi:Tfp pilus assembly protein PilE
MFILFFLLQEVADKSERRSSGSPVLWFALITTIITTILGPIVVPYFQSLFKRVDKSAINKTDADIAKVDAEAEKIRIDNSRALLTQLIEITEKFKIAQEEYLKMKQSFLDLRSDVEDLLDLIENNCNVPLVTNPQFIQIKKKFHQSIVTS